MPVPVPSDLLGRLLSQLPAAVREQAAQIAPRLLPQGPSAPGYFDVLANSINIMQDHITRTRLAGEPPHVMLVPRLRDIGLMEFNRAKEAIVEGRTCVEEALPMLYKGYTSKTSRRNYQFSRPSDRVDKYYRLDWPSVAITKTRSSVRPPPHRTTGLTI